MSYNIIAVPTFRKELKKLGGTPHAVSLPFTASNTTYQVKVISLSSSPDVIYIRDFNLWETYTTITPDHYSITQLTATATDITTVPDIFKITAFEVKATTLPIKAESIFFSIQPKLLFYSLRRIYTQFWFIYKIWAAHF